jgi:hypothetical protein
VKPNHEAETTTDAAAEEAKKGFRGYPVATIAYYGPDDKRASRVAVGIAERENGEPARDEGIDYPEGIAFPQCPFWAGRDRWTGKHMH